jgi:hypothetical protein
MSTIVALADRPDLAPIVSDWIWHEWSRHDGYSFDETLEYIEASSARKDIPQTFVLLVDGKPVGTSSLVTSDMKERPNLTPWMASVFVIPEARRAVIGHRTFDAEVPLGEIGDDEEKRCGRVWG